MSLNEESGTTVFKSSFLWVGPRISLSNPCNVALSYGDNSRPTLSDYYVTSEVPLLVFDFLDSKVIIISKI